MKFTERQIIILSGLLLFSPLFLVGFKGHDAVNHLIISRLFAEQFFSGDIYPRWLFKAEHGFGSPVLYFFPRLHYYVTLLFYPLKYLDALLNFPQGYLALYFSGALALVLSGFTAYQCLQIYTDKKQALAGAVFYMACSYHLLDIYSRYAFSEVWAFIFLPLCVHAVKTNGFNKLVLSFAGLMLTHAMIMVIFTPFLAILIFAQKRCQLLLALLIGFALCLFYWLPGMIYELQISSPDGQGIYSIAYNFLKTGDVVLFSAAILFVLIIILAGLNFSKDANRQSVFWLAVTIFCVFMSCSLSAFVWNFLPVALQKISFPWRFLTIATFSSTILFTKLPQKLMPMLIILSIALAYSALIEKNVENPARYLDQNMLTLDNFRGRSTPQDLVSNDGFKDLRRLLQHQFPGLQISFNTNKIHFSSDRAGWVTLPQFYFSAFHSQLLLRPELATGLMQAYLPAPGTFTIELLRSRPEKLSLAFSAVIFVLMILKCRLAFIRRKARQF